MFLLKASISFVINFILSQFEFPSVIWISSQASQSKYFRRLVWSIIVSCKLFVPYYTHFANGLQMVAPAFSLEELKMLQVHIACLIVNTAETSEFSKTLKTWTSKLDK
jgi:hypothetical protein